MAEGTSKRTLDQVSLSPDANQSKKHQGGGSPENGGDSAVRNHSGDVSLSDKLSAVNKIAVDMCGHCNKTCDAEGVKGEALQCDLCEGWFHASCESISSKHYKSFSSLAKSIPNMVYYCKHNKCQSRIKFIVAEFTKASVTESAQISVGVNDSIKCIDKSIADLTVQVSKCIEDLGSKFENLLSNQSGLQMEVDSIQNQSPNPDNSVQLRTTTTYASAASNAAHSIIDELADRDRCKKNAIIYNLPEAKDHTADKNSFLTLCKTVFDLNVPVTRVVCLGKRLENKHRPLLVCFEQEDDKSTVISHSNRLCRHDQYKRYLLLLTEQNLNEISM